MTHFDEMVGLLYLEGQLEPARAQEVAAHAANCADCRTLLRALERESKLLSVSLTEEDEMVPARLLSAPGWGISSWIWAATFGVFAVGTYWLWTDSIDPWLEQLGNAGFGGTDLASMLLFSGAFWEGWGEMISILEIAGLIVLGIGGFALLMRRFRRTTTSAAALLFVLALAVIAPQPAAATEVRRSESVIVPTSETIHTDLIVAGQSVRIDGTVEGDLIAFTGSLTVTGHVTGDIIAFAGQIRMDGMVDGNMRVASRMVTIEGSVGKNVTSLANTLDLTSPGKIGGSLLSLAAQDTLDGHIQHDLFGLVARTYLDGSLGGEMWLRGRSLAIGSTAQIGGASTFQSPNQPTIATGAKLAVPIRVEIQQETRNARFSAVRTVIHEIVSYGAALLVGLFVLTVLPGFFRATLREAARIGLPIGVGALALITSIALLILGILLLFVGVGAALAGALLYAPVAYLSQIFVSNWLGTRILGPVPIETTGEVIGRMALGLLILHVAEFIPVVGFLVGLTVVLWGTGAVLLGLYRLSHAPADVVAA